MTIDFTPDEIRILDLALNVSTDPDDAADETEIRNPRSVLQSIRGKVRCRLNKIDSDDANALSGVRP